MPLYDFKCDECNRIETDVSLPVSKSGSYTCSQCGKVMRQVFSPIGFRLKGDGWAKDGYSKKEK